MSRLTMNHKSQPPVATAKPHEIRSEHGVRNDEYYWLRDDTRKNQEMLDYLTAENKYADAVLGHTKPLQEELYQEIVGRMKQDDSTVPYRDRGYWYYRKFETGKEYPIHARRKDAPDAKEEVLLDVNRMAEGHDFFQVGNYEISRDDRWLAWAEDSVGRRQFTIRIRNLATGEVLPDAIENVEAGFVWAGDSKTLLYVAKDPVTLLGDKVKKHTLGTDAEKDPLVYQEPDDTFYIGVTATKDDEYLAIVSQSTVSSEMRVAKANDAALKFRVLLPRERDHEYSAEHLQGRWILRTNWQAKNFRIVAAGQDAADRSAWRDVVAHREDAFVESFDVFRDFLAVEERSTGLSNVRIVPWRSDKPFLIVADEPAYTIALGANAEIDSDTVRYAYTSMITPPSTYDLNVKTGAKTLLKREPVLGGFDSANYVAEFLWAPARDGVKVPVSLAYRKGRTGPAPLLQIGYGSYGSSYDPTFSSSLISMLDRGFIVAIAHIRGGQELGRDWYEYGKLLHKRNSFTDFIDVTRHLVATRHADPKRVFAMGGSAGGLLMGAVANMAPKHYRGIVALVPFVDVVTTMMDESIPLTTNEYDEWGNPAEKQYYDYMLGYSPYDNVTRQGYPALYVGTGLWDSQVQYFEPAKWVARLRKLKTDDNVLVFRVDMEAGHGGKSGRFRHQRETAEYYAFMLDLAQIAR